MGATKTLKVTSSDPIVVAQQVRDTLGGMPDCAVEASGAQFSVQMGIRVRHLSGLCEGWGKKQPQQECDF